MAVSTASAPPEAYEQALTQGRVFPRKPAPTADPADKAALAVAPESLAAQVQTAGAVQEQDADMAVIKQAAGGTPQGPPDIRSILGG